MRAWPTSTCESSWPRAENWYWIWPAGAEKVHPFADPGDEIVYLGSLTLVIGLIVVFVFKKKLVEIERRRNQAA